MLGATQPKLRWRSSAFCWPRVRRIPPTAQAGFVGALLALHHTTVGLGVFPQQSAPDRFRPVPPTHKAQASRTPVTHPPNSPAHGLPVSERHRVASWVYLIRPTARSGARESIVFCFIQADELEIDIDASSNTISSNYEQLQDVEFDDYSYGMK